jgi:hypothetical protein
MPEAWSRGIESNAGGQGVSRRSRPQTLTSLPGVISDAALSRSSLAFSSLMLKLSEMGLVGLTQHSCHQGKVAVSISQNGGKANSNSVLRAKARRVAWRRGGSIRAMACDRAATAYRARTWTRTGGTADKSILTEASISF